MTHDAVNRLKKIEERKAEVIELRYFGGLTHEEISEAMAIPVITARRDVAFGEAWLRRALSETKA